MGECIKSNWVVWIVALLLDATIPIIMICNRSNSKNFGVSIAAFCVFTASLAYTFCWFTSFTINTHPGACQGTALMGMGLAIGLNVYVMSTHKELAVRWLGLFWIIVSVAIPMIFTLIFEHKEWAFLTLAALSLVVLGLHVVFDSYRMTGKGQSKHSLTMDEFVLFNLMLWADLPSIVCDYAKHEE